MEKIALVTGASRGIGKATALALARDGWTVHVNYIRSREAAEAVAAQTGGMAICADVSDGQAVSAMFEKIGPVDLLVNNAGCGYLGNIGEIDTVSQTRMIDLNLRALTAITNLSVPYMEAGSRILNVSSIASFCPTPRMTVYSATKAYVSAYTIGAAEELKAKGITVTAVCPGPMATEFLAVGHVVDSRPF